ncbi:MAG: hypothetical protein IPL61_19775 [Myxococcales bacterium]|nr:hypothetical protein [Myxococcales bacterium]
MLAVALALLAGACELDVELGRPIDGAGPDAPVIDDGGVPDAPAIDDGAVDDGPIEPVDAPALG